MVEFPPPQVTNEDEQVAEEVPVERALEPAPPIPDGPANAIDVDDADAVADDDKTMVDKHPPVPPLDGVFVDIVVLPPPLFNAPVGGWMVSVTTELPDATMELAEDTFGPEGGKFRHGSPSSERQVEN